MKRYAVFSLLVLLCCTGGDCDELVNINADADIGIINSIDLMVQVMDSYTGGPYTGPGELTIPAVVRVIATGDEELTGADGWTTLPLRTPPEAEHVTIKVTWHRHKLGGGSEPDSRQFGVRLTHGTTEYQVWVDTRPLL